MEPRVFIGSSGEAHDVAVALQTKLERAASVTVWSQGAFEVNRGNLDNLMAATTTYDFAVIVATPDDLAVSRSKEFLTPRDNIIFEFGLFIGSLGLDRAFLVHPRSPTLKLPSDLFGVTLIDYKPADENNPIETVLAPVAEKLSRLFRQAGRKRNNTSRRYGPILERAQLDRISNVADAALYYSRPRCGYKSDIEAHLARGEVLPSHFYYITEEGAQNWLRMCADPHYRFHGSSMQLVRALCGQIASAIHSRYKDIDFISLGSGDGEKDHLLLSELARLGVDIVYYPIDISDKLLVECIRNVFKGNLDHQGVRTKAIIADMTSLSVLRCIYEDRPSPNLFSVLGNTFGNTDEARIAAALKESMYSGDLLLIEVNCDTTAPSAPGSFLNSKFISEYSCLPLAILGLPYSADRLSVREVNGVSIFKSATSAVTVYSDMQVGGRTVEAAPLFHDHRYDFEYFEKELAELLDLNILVAEKHGSAGLILAERR